MVWTTHEPEDLETLNMYPETDRDLTITQSISLAPLDDRLMSMIVNQIFKSGRHAYIHMFFTDEEVDVLIEALQETKKRWDSGKVL